MAFEQFLNQKQGPGTRSRWRGLTYLLSLSLHGALLLTLLVRSFWHVDELEPRGVPITLMFLRPPPPPPPAPAQTRTAPDPRPKVAQVLRPRRPALVQPVERKEAPAPREEATASRDESGQPGGVEGGVPGGAPSAITALAPAPPAARPIDPMPVMLAPNVGTGQRLSDLNDPRFRPILPPSLNRGGMVVWGLFRVCVTTGGRVKDVKILRSADALVDSNWSQVIQRWEYRPYSMDGRPVAFCHTARIEVRAL
jgi:periplasmic protein TonB